MGIREIRSTDLLVEVKCASKDRRTLESAFRNFVGESSSVQHLVPMVEAEILDIDPTMKVPEVEEEFRSCLHEETT